MKVCHITTVHHPTDVRIFARECVSLAANGFETVLIARAGHDQEKDGVKIAALPDNKASGINRLTNMWRALKKALGLRAGLYHFHDPELLPVGILLKILTRRKVIYDAHEDVKAHAMSKSWKGKIFARLVANGLRALERFGTPFFDAIIVPVTTLPDFGKKTVLVRNYPIVPAAKPPVKTRDGLTLVYLGGIREKRCPFEILQAIIILKRTYPKILFYLLGPFFPANLEARTRAFVDDHHLQGNVKITGRIPWQEGCRFIEKSDIGLCITYPEQDFARALPTKMFEYMMYGKPVVVSGFPAWKRIVDETGCGVTIPPGDSLDPKKIAGRIDALYADRHKMAQMGADGRHAVEQKYNWKNEARTLILCYQKLLKRQPGNAG